MNESNDVVHLFTCFRDDAPMTDLCFLGRIIHRFLECFQFNTHMVEAVLGNRLIAPDAETRIWNDALKFAHGEFVENVRLGSGIYPTLVRYFHATLQYIFVFMRQCIINPRQILLRPT